MMRLSHEVVPLWELRGLHSAPPTHEFVTDKEEDDDSPALIAIKYGRTTGATAGAILDIMYVSRSIGDDGKEHKHRELAIVGLSRNRIWPDQTSDRFSARGDSGAAVFDLKGRSCGMVTSSSRNDQGRQAVDITYATPMAVLLPAIEKEVGMRLRVL